MIPENNSSPIHPPHPSLTSPYPLPEPCDCPPPESDAFYKAILERVSETVLVTNEDGQFTFISPNIESLLGYSPAELEELGQIQALLDDELFEYDRLETCEEIKGIEQKITDKRGNVRWLSIDLKSIPIIEGARLYCCRDISDRKQRELERDRCHEILEASTIERHWIEHHLQAEIQAHQITKEKADRSE
ncbi:MAG: PAS domain S-box protein, partial [Cyanobacteriota bacterium]|nr:PAS domain S-box protein [Cyanobacteriota bacterium]